MNVKINQKLLDLFKERNVYFTPGGAQHPYERFANSSVTYDRKFVIFSECIKDTGKNGLLAKPISSSPPA